MKKPRVGEGGEGWRRDLFGGVGGGGDGGGGGERDGGGMGGTAVGSFGGADELVRAR